MNSPGSPASLAPEIAALLAGVRWRIRAYIIAYGLAAAVIWLGLTFWLFLGVDYFLVVVGSNELPRALRATLLAVIAVVFGVIVFRLVVSRLMVRLSDQSMAVLVERKFREFRDSLLTSVEVAERPTEASIFSEEMLGHTGREAQAMVSEISPAKLFNRGPLLRVASLALALLVSVVAFFFFDRDSFSLWGSRLYALSDTPWPRKAQVEVVSVSVSRGESDQEPHTVNFVDQVVKVARGANVVLTVRADGRRFVPEVCSILYRTDDGGAGRPHMQRQGRVREDAFQYYNFGDAPLSKIYSSIDFDIIGYDHRLRGYRIEVVDSPVVVQATIAFEPPTYMIDEKAGVLRPPPKPVMAGMALPAGARCTLVLECNKPLSAIRVRDVETLAPVEFVARLVASRAEIDMGALTKNVGFDFDLIDQDDVRSERPFRVTLTATPDKPPEIDLALKGLGRLITTAARVPVQGVVRDDFGLEHSPEGVELAWFEVKRGEQVAKFPFELGKAGALEAALDFDSRAPVSSGDFKLVLGDKLTLFVKARDRCDLGGQPNVGASAAVNLEVVSADELLADVAARVLEMRRLLEHVVEETAASRDSLVRLRTGDAEPVSPVPASAENPPVGSPAKDAAPAPAAITDSQRLTLKLLRVQHCRQQGVKSQGETLGAAGAFDDLAAELENNRVDAQDRKEKLRGSIALPLRKIATDSFAKLEKSLAKVESGVSDPAVASALVEDSIQNCQEILRDLEGVLAELRELEEYNELVKIMRDLIRDESAIISDTKRQRDEELLK